MLISRAGLCSTGKEERMMLITTDLIPDEALCLPVCIISMKEEVGLSAETGREVVKGERWEVVEY